jgi:hypothetical protein
MKDGGLGKLLARPDVLELVELEELAEALRVHASALRLGNTCTRYQVRSLELELVLVTLNGETKVTVGRTDARA